MLLAAVCTVVIVGWGPTDCPIRCDSTTRTHTQAYIRLPTRDMLMIFHRNNPTVRYTCRSCAHMDKCFAAARCVLSMVANVLRGPRLTRLCKPTNVVDLGSAGFPAALRVRAHPSRSRPAADGIAGSRQVASGVLRRDQSACAGTLHIELIRGVFYALVHDSRSAIILVNPTRFVLTAAAVLLTTVDSSCHPFF